MLSAHIVWVERHLEAALLTYAGVSLDNVFSGHMQQENISFEMGIIHAKLQQCCECVDAAFSAPLLRAFDVSLLGTSAADELVLQI